MARNHDSSEKIRIKYYEDNMSRGYHLMAYIGFAVAIGVILYIYYHHVMISVVGGLILSYFQEKNYAKSVQRKRQRQLRLQFKEFLEIITISVSGGSGRSIENAVADSIHDLEMLYNEKADIVREIRLIVSDYQLAGIPMHQGFLELGERSEIDDIVSFATVYATIEGKTSDFGYIISQTHDVIKDKVEITMEIETGIAAAKSEAYMMLVLPLVLIIVMSTMGSDFLNGLFTTAIGRMAATFGVACTFVSYVIAVRATEIDV